MWRTGVVPATRGDHRRAVTIVGPVGPCVGQADSLGLDLVAAADIRNWTFQTTGSSVLGRVVGSLPPVVILDGRRDNGAIISGVFVEPQRPGTIISGVARCAAGVPTLSVRPLQSPRDECTQHHQHHVRKPNEYATGAPNETPLLGSGGIKVGCRIYGVDRLIDLIAIKLAAAR